MCPFERVTAAACQCCWLLLLRYAHTLVWGWGCGILSTARICCYLVLGLHVPQSVILIGGACLSVLVLGAHTVVGMCDQFWIPFGIEVL